MTDHACSSENYSLYALPQTHLDMLHKMASDITSLFDRHNILYFIDGGTLLGCVREKGQIPYDDDLDFGILVQQDFYVRLPKLFAEIKSLGYQVEVKGDDVVKVFIPNQWMWTPFKVIGTPTLDLFPYELKKGKVQLHKLIHRRKWPKAQHNEKDLFPLKEWQYGNIKLKGANNPHPYLDGMYPNWKTKRVIELRGLPKPNQTNVKEETIEMPFLKRISN